MVKFKENEKCPFYRLSGAFRVETRVNIMHRNVGVMQFYAPD